ncbi:MAG TPA: ferritin-like domain-containing protein [Dehalococcoidia bacterium]
MTNATVDAGTESSRAVVVEILQRLWHTKLSSIALLERWLGQTTDADIQAGLTNQIVDERRHATLIGEQIRRLGGRIGGQATKDAVTRIFDEAASDREDVRKLFAFYRGVKAYTVDRCGHLMPHVDRTLADVLEALSRDEERHIRWADMRVQRLLTHEKMRECNLLLGHVLGSLETAWGRHWRQLPWTNLKRRGA